jgi:hypothetical protein
MEDPHRRERIFQYSLSRFAVGILLEAKVPSRLRIISRSGHITAEDISRVRKHQELDRENIRTIKNSSLEKNKKKEVQPTNTEEEYPIDKLVLGT